MHLPRRHRRQGKGRRTPFLAELERQLAARDSSREDRLLAYTFVDDFDARTP